MGKVKGALQNLDDRITVAFVEARDRGTSGEPNEGEKDPLPDMDSTGQQFLNYLEEFLMERSEETHPKWAGYTFNELEGVAKFWEEFNKFLKLNHNLKLP